MDTPLPVAARQVQETCPPRHPFHTLSRTTGQRPSRRGKQPSPAVAKPVEPRLASRTHLTSIRMLASAAVLRTILAAAVLAACSRPAEQTPSSAATSSTLPTSVGMTGDTAGIATRADRGRIRGDSAAPLWVVIISDFQCPYCRQWHDEVYPSIVREYVDTRKVRLAYVNLPLSNHQHAQESAEAAMCAAVQGRFWEMHDALFRTQGRWARMEAPRTVFDSLAASVGIDPAPYRACVESNATRQMVLADAQRVTEAGASVTPTFFIGSERVEGAMPLPEFRAALDRALAASR